MSNPVLAVVAAHPFTAGLDADHVNRLAAMAREMCFDTGRVIFPEGDQSREFYLLVHGMVALEICSGGSQHRFQTLYANDEFGWSSLMPDKSKVLQARALDRVDVLVFDARGARTVGGFVFDGIAAGRHVGAFRCGNRGKLGARTCAGGVRRGDLGADMRARGRTVGAVVAIRLFTRS